MSDDDCQYIFYEDHCIGLCGISGDVCDPEDCPGYEDLRVRKGESMNDPD